MTPRKGTRMRVKVNAPSCAGLMAGDVVKVIRRIASTTIQVEAGNGDTWYVGEDEIERVKK